jgi:CheY-like chemotaxis protein
MPCHRATVLLVEDDAEVALLLSAVLSEFGYQVRQAHDGLAALVQIAVEPPDVVLCDLNLPIMTGAELLAIVRRQFPKVLIIAMSGAPSKCIPPGVTADAFYEKGRAPGSLLEILGALTSPGNSKQADAHDSQLAS